MDENKLIKYDQGQLLRLGNSIAMTNKLLTSIKRGLDRSPEFVILGNQKWAIRNLNVSLFRNGDIIPEVKTIHEWQKAEEKKRPAWCYYDNDIENGDKFGKLYNWYAVIDKRGLAPDGWHVPNDQEWTSLANYLGGESIAGKEMKGNSGFIGLPGGFRNVLGVFKALLDQGRWWSSTECNVGIHNWNAWYRLLSYNNDSYNKDHDQLYREYYYKTQGLSVRCLKE